MPFFSILDIGCAFFLAMESLFGSRCFVLVKERMSPLLQNRFLEYIYLYIYMYILEI